MFSWDDPKDRAKIVRLTAEVRSVEVELLSAMCATDRPRLHYSAEDVARFAERHVLQKAVSSATALHNYFSAIAKKMGLAPSSLEPDR